MREKFLRVFLLAAVICCLFNNNILGQEEKVKGFDVHSWDKGTITWNGVHQNNYKFVFTKISGGIGYKNTKVEENVKEALDEGLLVGVFHFARPVKYSPMNEAQWFAECFNKLVEKYPATKRQFIKPALDIENYEDAGEYPGQQLGKNGLSNWIHEWMKTVKTLTGIEPILYTGSDYTKNYLNTSTTQYHLWIAHWTNNPNPNIGIWETAGKTWDFWQWAGEREDIEWIKRSVDLDLFNGNETKLQDFRIVMLSILNPTQSNPGNVGPKDNPNKIKILVKISGYSYIIHGLKKSDFQILIGERSANCKYP